MKRDTQRKFALKNEDYRLVRSLRLTDSTWAALGVAAECLGLTRSDYLEQIVGNDTQPSNTRQERANLPGITQYEEHPRQDKAEVIEPAVIALPQMAELENLRNRILLDLKLGKQASGYKTAQKALNHFIAELPRLG